VVARDLTRNFVLGMNFLRTKQANLNFSRNLPSLSLFDDLNEIPICPRGDDGNCATVARTTCIPPYTEAFLTVNTPKQFNDLDVLLENAERVSCVSVAGALPSAKTTKLFVKF